MFDLGQETAKVTFLRTSFWAVYKKERNNEEIWSIIFKRENAYQARN